MPRAGLRRFSNFSHRDASQNTQTKKLLAELVVEAIVLHTSVRSPLSSASSSACVP